MKGDIETFVSLVLPWDFRHDKPVYFNVHWKTDRVSPKSGKPYWGGRAAVSAKALANTIAWAKSLASVQDIYICMSAQNTAEQKVSSKNNTYFEPVRLQPNTLALRSLYMDLDVKEGAYADQSEALAALMGMVTQLGIPMPSALISSGTGGVHAHWALSEDIDPATWQSMADALAVAAEECGILFDRQCTIDCVRIMRVPNTLNFKTTPPSKVEALAFGERVDFAAMLEALTPYIGRTPERKRATVQKLFEVDAPSLPAIPAQEDLIGGLEGFAVGLAKVDDVAASCGFVKTALAENGASYNNPLWFLTASIAQFCEDGRAALHRMSSGHASYSVAETDDLYDRLEREHAERDIGWPQCASIASAGAEACKTCPLLQQNKSPLNHAVRSAPPKPVPRVVNGQIVDVFPNGYAAGADGLIYRQEVAEDGSLLSAPVCPYPIKSGWLQDDPWTLHFISSTGAGRKTNVSVQLEQLASKESVTKIFGKQGIILKEKGAVALREFLVAWIQKLQQQKDAVVSSVPFGWIELDGKLDGFAYAGRVWSADGDRPAANTDPVLLKQYTPVGNLDAWLDAMKFTLGQGRPALHVILATAFAGPLFTFTGENGALISFYSSESGVGKTTAMRTAQAVWGHPVRAGQGLEDTGNQLFGKMGRLKSLPLFWDEIKGEAQSLKFASYLFQLTGGKEKGRMNADTTLREVNTWQTLLVSASNDSLIDPIMRTTKATTAGLYRMFECEVDGTKNPDVTHSVIARMTAEMNMNFGQAGLLFAQFLGANAVRIREEMHQYHDDMCREFAAQQDERYWLAVISTVLKGAEYANELGLGAFDIPAMKAYIQVQLTRARSTVSEAPVDMKNTMSVSNILAQFLNAMRTRHTLITDRIHVGRGKPAKGSIAIKCDVSRLDGIYVQIGRDDGMLRISSTYLTRWMGEHEYSRHAFTRALEAEFGMRVVNGKLGSGTEMSGAMEYLIELDMNDPKLKQFLE